MYIPNDNTNLWLKRLDTELNKPINQNSVKVPIVVESIYNKTLRTTNSPMSPPSLNIYYINLKDIIQGVRGYNRAIFFYLQ